MRIKIILAFFLITNALIAQSVNDYAAVIVPIKFSFQNEENEYRLSTITKYNLEQAGFVVFYSNVNFSNEYPDRCSVLNIDVVKDSGFLTTKLYVEFKDCFGKVIYTSETGKSKEKEFGTAYKEALNNAFESIYKLEYKYNGSTAVKTQPATAKVETVKENGNNAPVSSVVSSVNAELLYAQPTENGFQLIDKTPKVVMKLMKTGTPNSFIAFKGELQGVLNMKDNQWVFDSYQNGVLVSEVLLIKF
ncbi:hypothetical protein [Flavobacterium faecale]|uniref:hypothetical protein n=1 Tax=Flavobacterium faecale TaxID=1355330 RepID=UPI003AAB2E21